MEQEKDIKFYYTSLSILPPRAADMESKSCYFLGRGGACSSRLIGVFFHGGRIWNAPLRLWSERGRGPPELAVADFAAGEISMEQRMYFPI